jgi:hypothetical protein
MWMYRNKLMLFDCCHKCEGFMYIKGKVIVEQTNNQQNHKTKFYSMPSSFYS